MSALSLFPSLKYISVDFYSFLKLSLKIVSGLLWSRSYSGRSPPPSWGYRSHDLCRRIRRKMLGCPYEEIPIFFFQQCFHTEKTVHPNVPFQLSRLKRAHHYLELYGHLYRIRCHNNSPFLVRMFFASKKSLDYVKLCSDSTFLIFYS